VWVCAFTSIENLDAFVEQLLSGQLKPYLKSEPVPTSNEGPVKVSFIHNMSEGFYSETDFGLH